MKKISSKIAIFALLIISHTPFTCQAIQQGIVIILSGTSTSGKSSIAHHIPLLFNQPFEHVAFDNYLTEVFLEQLARPLPEKEFHERIHQQICTMYDYIKDLSLQGKNVLVDTVLSALEGEKDVQLALEKLQGIHVTALVLVYCPLPILAQRIERRNQKALLENKPENMRSITWIKFEDIFKIRQSHNEIALDTLSRRDIELAYAAPHTATTQEIAFYDHCKSALCSYFNLIDTTSVIITPKLHYDCIINTSSITPEQAAYDIYDCIISRTLNAFRKNCQLFSENQSYFTSSSSLK